MLPRTAEWYFPRMPAPQAAPAELGQRMSHDPQPGVDMVRASVSTARSDSGAERGGDFAAEDLAEAETFAMTLSGAQPLRSRIDLVNPD